MANNISNDPNLLNWDLVAVNPREKNWNWFDIFNLWANNTQSLVAYTLFASLFLISGLNGWLIFFSIFLSGLFIVWLLNLIGKPSLKYGLPFAVIARSSLGIFGAKYIVMLRGIVALFMFGLQTYLASRAISVIISLLLKKIGNENLLNNLLNVHYFEMASIEWVSFIFVSLLQLILFCKGMNIVRIVMKFFGIFTYIILIAFALTTFVNNDITKDFSILFSGITEIADKDLIKLISIFGTIFTFFAVTIINFGDFSRFVQNESQMKKGNLSLLLNLLFFFLIVIIICLGAKINFDQILINPTDILFKYNSLTITLFATLALFMSSLGTNLITSFVPSTYNLINFAPKIINFRIGGYITIFIGFVVGGLWVSVISKIGILPIIDTIGAILGPIFGVIVTDYYIVKKQNLNTKYLFSADKSGEYYYSNGWNLKALYAILIAGILSLSTIWHPNLNSFHSFGWILGAALGSFMQYLLSKK